MNTNEKKLDNIKRTLLELYNQLPDQFALQNVKTSFQKTIHAITEVQTKRHKRQIQQNQNSMQDKMQFTSLEAAQKALQILDKMMQDEQKKIDQPPEPNQQQNNPGLLNG